MSNLIFSENKNLVNVVILGILAAFFFSSTFVINRWISTEGGHWYWTATLRYIFVILILTPFLAAFFGRNFLKRCLKCFVDNIWFWLLSGGIGFGVFYLTLCYSASFAPGWVIATTWQLTILISPVMLRTFKFSIKSGSFLFSSIAFIGVLMVNYHEFTSFDNSEIKGAIYVLIAAVSYPFGITLCKLAMTNRLEWIEIGDTDLLDNTFARIWLMSLGCIPILIITGILAGVSELPSMNQTIGVGYVAISTGVIATSILFYASQNVAKNGDEISAVLSTQSFEVPFALMFEVLFLGSLLPSIIGWVGIFAVVIGASGYIFSSNQK